MMSDALLGNVVPITRQCNSPSASEGLGSVLEGAAYSDAMRFDRMFEDLEARFAHHEDEEMRAVSEELGRAERAQVTLADRLRGAGDAPLTLHLGADLRLIGQVDELGPDWLLLQGTRSAPERAIIPLNSISLVLGLPVRARPETESVLSPRSLGSLLREVARDRSIVRMHTAAGMMTGRLSTVGADALDLHTLPTGESTLVPGSTRVTVPLPALRALLLQ